MAQRGGKAGCGTESAALQAGDRTAPQFDINGCDPRQYGLDFGLWTRSVVADLIEWKFAVRLGVSAVGELLAKLGLHKSRCNALTSVILKRLRLAARTISCDCQTGKSLGR
jgi:Winged helix-turn helix